MSNRPGQPVGFTLLEMLVATAMTAVLAGSLYATLHVTFKARTSAHAAVDQVRKVELALEMIRADLESAVIPRGILAGPFLGEPSTDSSGRPSDTIVLHTAADAAQDREGTGDIRMVELACEPDEDGPGQALLRRVSVRLLATKVEEPSEELLCRGVRSFSLSYFDGLEWQDGWDSGMLDNALPLAVEVSLELMSEDGADADRGGYWASRVFRLPCSSLTTGLEVEMGMP